MWFHANCKIAFSVSVKNAIGIFIGIALMALGNMDVLTILILLIHEHEISFQLFVFFNFFYYHLIVCIVPLSSPGLSRNDPYPGLYLPTLLLAPGFATLIQVYYSLLDLRARLILLI